MQSDQWILTFCKCLLTSFVFATSAAQAADSATEPTASQDPAQIDQLWQSASAKFDIPRNAILKQVDLVSHLGPFRPDWQSLQDYQVPEWYEDAKLGIFIHWGVYSVPAFDGEWYSRNMYTRDSEVYKHHLATYGTPDKFGYKEFIPMFKAEHFDPDAWARLFKQAGARYVIPVAEHHDGFAMYDSDLSDWTAVRMGPHRDIIGDLARAVREQGMHFGVSSHRVEHDFFLGVGREIKSDVNDPQYAAFYGPAHTRMQKNLEGPVAGDFTYVSSAWADDWLARSAEIVTKYHPDIIYFDWWIGQPALRPNLSRFAAFYYNASEKFSGQPGVINYKDLAFQDRAGVLDVERGQLADIRPQHWQSDTSVSNKAWGYIKDDEFKSPQYIIHTLIDIVSKNGNLLLNVGPRADGTIPENVQHILLELGAWLKVNGEAIYGTRPWKIYGEGPTKAAAGSFHEGEIKPYTAADFRFTRNGNVLYAIELAKPETGEAVIHALRKGKGSDNVITSVSLLGAAGKLEFAQKADGLHIQTPARMPGKYAYAYRIEFAA